MTLITRFLIVSSFLIENMVKLNAEEFLFLHRQSCRRDDFVEVFVDDGSFDGVDARLIEGGRDGIAGFGIAFDDIVCTEVSLDTLR